MDRIKDFLHEAGIEFAEVPAGQYKVGADPEKIQLMARPPQWQFDFFRDWVTREELFSTKGFLITKTPITLSQCKKILSALPVDLGMENLVSKESLEITGSRRTLEESFEVFPTGGEQQMAFVQDETPSSRFIPQQKNEDPVMELGYQEACSIINALAMLPGVKKEHLSLPEAREWEAAARGAEGYLYPWGNEMDLSVLSLEEQDYSVDEESTMGYYSYDQYVYYIHDFGKYKDMASPFGLKGFAYAGREWNLLEGNPVFRSISDLGAMTFRIPGIRYNTVGGGENFSPAKHHLAFSGPVLACFALPSVGSERSSQGKPLFTRAGVRLVLRP